MTSIKLIENDFLCTCPSLFLRDGRYHCPMCSKAYWLVEVPEFEAWPEDDRDIP